MLSAALLWSIKDVQRIRDGQWHNGSWLFIRFKTMSNQLMSYLTALALLVVVSSLSIAKAFTERNLVY